MSRWWGRWPWRPQRRRSSVEAAGSPCCCRWRWRPRGTSKHQFTQFKHLNLPLTPATLVSWWAKSQDSLFYQRCGFFWLFFSFLFFGLFLCLCSLPQLSCPSPPLPCVVKSFPHSFCASSSRVIVPTFLLLHFGFCYLSEISLVIWIFLTYLETKADGGNDTEGGGPGAHPGQTGGCSRANSLCAVFI